MMVNFEPEIDFVKHIQKRTSKSTIDHVAADLIRYPLSVGRRLTELLSTHMFKLCGADNEVVKITEIC